jgi:hypothetical protein
VQKIVKEHCIITGGSIASLLQGEPVKDYDFYFDSKDNVKKVAEYYVAKFNAARKENGNAKTTEPKVYIDKDDSNRVRISIKSAGVIGLQTDTSEYQYFESEGEQGNNADEYVSKAMLDVIHEADQIDGGLLDGYENKDKELYKPVFLSDNAITLSGKIQLIIRFHGSIDDIHSNFDYAHCTNYWTPKDGLTLRPDAIESLMCKDLRYIGSKYPICSIIRLRRFLRKGWFANAGQILKICMQISKLNLENIAVLEDQLTGVDTAYFHEMVRILKEEQKKGKQIDQTYIVTLVDRMF